MINKEIKRKNNCNTDQNKIHKSFMHAKYSITK